MTEISLNPDSFGGQDIPHGCLPDYHFTKCPGRERGLGGDDWTDKTEWCKYSEKADADSKGFGYDSCSFCGDSYRECQNFLAAEKRKESLENKVV